jgi:hypothetical protein
MFYKYNKGVLEISSNLNDVTLLSHNFLKENPFLYTRTEVSKRSWIQHSQQIFHGS